MAHNLGSEVCSQSYLGITVLRGTNDGKSQGGSTFTAGAAGVSLAEQP